MIVALEEFQCRDYAIVPDENRFLLFRPDSTIGESIRLAYGVSKAALNQLTRHLASRYGRDGIRANAIAPGFIMTATAASNVPRDVQERLAGANPTRRLGTPDDVARVVVFLCSDASSYVNGQVIHVDGGYNIAGVM